MTTSTPTPTPTIALPDLVLDVEQTIDIDAPPERAFQALLGRLGPKAASPEGQSMDLRIEARPGGRWYRDLGDEQGHLWGHVQVIKPPTLLEIQGPMFMSYAVAGHIQFRMTERAEGVRVTMRHQAVGLISPDHRAGLTHGWTTMLEGARIDAESDHEV